MAPILSFTAEQLSDYYQKDKQESIHLQRFPKLCYIWETLCVSTSANEVMGRYCGAETTLRGVEKNESIRFYENSWQMLKELRPALLKMIEVEREKQSIKHSLEARVTLYINPKMSLL